jgi:2',3'-cyclic-nucleotide 2'-phosphodiesterase (5'-nucleotidase family)
MARLVILHTADFHNRLTPERAARIKARKAAEPAALLLDAGDAVKAGNLGAQPGGEPTLRLMSEIGYDAMAMGNRESHPSRRLLQIKLRDARFPVLAANLMAKRKPPPAKVHEYIIIESPAGEVAVGVFGLAPQVTSPQSWWSKVADYVFDDPVKTAVGLAPKLREECQLLIALTHIGIELDRRVAESADVDLVIGGHSHLPAGEPERVGRAWVAHAPPFGKAMGRIEFEVGGARAKLVAAETIPL